MERRSFIKNLSLGSLSVTALVSCSTGVKAPVATSSAIPQDIDDVPTFKNSSQIRSGIALGGIGAGSIEMRPDGNFHNWSIFNNYPKGSGKPFVLPNLPNASDKDSLLFFIVKYHEKGQPVRFKLLQINDSLNEAGMKGMTYYYPWMTAIQNIEYSGVFPFVNVKYTDDEMPFDIRLSAFSPFIPQDVKNSSLPGVYFDFEIQAHEGKEVEVTLLSSLRNLIGYDTTEKYFKSELHESNEGVGFSHQVRGMDKTQSSFGEMGLTMLADDTSYYLGWEHKHPYYEKLLVEKKLANIDDTAQRNKPVPDSDRIRGHFSGRNTKDQRCFSTVAAHQTIHSGSSMKACVVFSWYFPNAYGSHQVPLEPFDGDYQINQKLTTIQGNYYNNFFDSNKKVAEYLRMNRNDLLKRTEQFQDDYFESSLPPYVLHQVNSNLNTFITSSTFTKDGKFAIREGLSPSQPWGPNGTIDVSLYGSIMILALFPELQKSMMSVHKEVQTDNGEIAHGLANQLNYTENGTWGVYHRLDLVPNYIQMVLRDYLFTGDQNFIKEIWPSVKRGINYILTERDKNGDQLPEMEGVMCSYDNFPMYGHASYILSQWASAMTLAAKVANELGEASTYQRYDRIAKKAITAMNKHLWNGKYYRLSNDTTGDKGIDEGCLTDQLVGQWSAYQAGIGRLFPEEKVKSSLREILDKSFKDDRFLRNCSWPEYPEYFPIEDTNWWVDQANTPWTGVELGFAAFLYYEGMVAEANQVIKSVDDRYRKAGLYWDHQEFGGHYYRPMSAWGIIHGALGYAVQNGSFQFDPKLKEKQFRLFFTGPEGTAHFVRTAQHDSIEVKTGKFFIKGLIVSGSSLADQDYVMHNGSKVSISRRSEKERLTKLIPDQPISLKKGDKLSWKRL